MAILENAQDQKTFTVCVRVHRQLKNKWTDVDRIFWVDHMRHIY